MVFWGLHLLYIVVRTLLFCFACVCVFFVDLGFIICFEVDGGLFVLGFAFC